MSAAAITVVVPVYRNRDTVRELSARLRAAFAAHGRNCGIIFVNDGCPDGSLGELRKLAGETPGILALDLDRNRGQHAAILAGLACVETPLAAVMDADLQDPPEDVPRLAEELERKQLNVVFGGRHGLYEPLGRIITSRLFKLVLSALTGLPRDAGGFLAMDRTARQRILSMASREPFLTALIGCAGLRTASVPIERSRRLSGESAYTGGMRLRAGLSAVLCVIRLRLGLDRKWLPSGTEAAAAIRSRYGTLPPES